MKNGTIKEREIKPKFHILVSNCPSKTVGEEESKERREEEEEEGRGEEEDQIQVCFCLRIMGIWILKV